MASAGGYQSHRAEMGGQSNRNVVGLALGMAALFFAVVAVLINTPILFYMGTALIMTIAASRLQAWLSVRELRFEREAPDPVKLGDTVTINLIVWSERKIRRPLITVADAIPSRLVYADKTVSTPIAPAFDLPIRTQYRFRPLKRGVFRWSGIEAVGTDALGLIVMTKLYETEPVELTVLPRSIPVSIDLPAARGWGISEAESGQSRGAGMEPRGVREYSSGDSLRHVHWASSAKRGQLLVKEFEAGSHTAASIVLQQVSGSDLGIEADTTLELMCGHAAYLAEHLMQQGALVQFPTLEGRPYRTSGAERTYEIYELLARVEANSTASLSASLHGALPRLPAGSILIAMMTLADPGLPSLGRQMRGLGIQMVAMIYDPAEFGVSRIPGGQAKAADPKYLDELESAGVMVRLISKGGEAS